MVAILAGSPPAAGGILGLSPLTIQDKRGGPARASRLSGKKRRGLVGQMSSARRPRGRRRGERGCRQLHHRPRGARRCSASLRIAPTRKGHSRSRRHRRSRRVPGIAPGRADEEAHRDPNRPALLRRCSPSRDEHLRSERADRLSQEPGLTTRGRVEPASGKPWRPWRSASPTHPATATTGPAGAFRDDEEGDSHADGLPGSQRSSADGTAGFGPVLIGHHLGGPGSMRRRSGAMNALSSPVEHD
jgi:hypothetical protein